MQQWMQCARQAQSERPDTKSAEQWDCEKMPNAPVERRQWRQACGENTASDYWPSRLGEPRDDLDRFYGEYESPDLGWIAAPAKAPMEMQDQGRGQIPRGYMMLYANRGDVAPYYLRSASDTHFHYTNSRGEERVAEFKTADDGRATALILNGERYVRRPQRNGR